MDLVFYDFELLLNCPGVRVRIGVLNGLVISSLLLLVEELLLLYMLLLLLQYPLLSLFTD